ncbi:MAG: hypothetical protein M1821_009703 [Bathelium mastoideum]|nr:MAG: hypothetical protein M1821_009703 [Bathelium mastoideum]KAI9690536.1 MAG: hypothetical protein M1822_009499 [Bathelium mastoideum]
MEELKWTEPEKYDYEKYTAKNPGEVAQDGLAWGSGAQRYEWDGEYGEVPPADEGLEKLLFQNPFKVRYGVNFPQLLIHVTQESTSRVAPISEFKDAGLHPVMYDTITRLLEYDSPTPVQSYVIPAVMQGRDVIACAQTGSGKTAAYLIPILSKLMGKYKQLAAPRPRPSTYDPKTDRVRAEPLVIIVAPSRELALQIFDEARKLCYRTMLRPCCVYGGAPSGSQREDLARGCDVLIGTCGRLIDFLSQPHVLSLNRIKYTIIDEADEMLQDDWREEMGRIVESGESNTNDDHTFLMFSATITKNARDLANDYMAADHVRLRVGRAGSTHQFIKQQIIWAEDSEKREKLYSLLNSLPPARTLIFVNSRRGADLLDDFLFNKNMPVTSIHSDRTQREREDSLRSFRSASSPVMIATGVSARGLDIANIMHVINYDLPSSDFGGIHEYVHRIGRTARIGNEGMATSFFNDRNEDIAEDLAKLLVEAKQELPDFLKDKAPEGELIFDDYREDDDEKKGDDDESAEQGAKDEATTTASGSAGFGGAGADDDEWKPQETAEGGGEESVAAGDDW